MVPSLVMFITLRTVAPMLTHTHTHTHTYIDTYIYVHIKTEIGS